MKNLMLWLAVLAICGTLRADEILIAHNHGGDAIVGNEIYFADKGTVTNWLDVTADTYVTAIELNLKAEPHAVSGKYADVRISIEPMRAGIWYDYNTDNAPRTIVVKAPPADPCGPSASYVLGPTGLSAVAAIPVGGWNNNGLQWYRFEMPEPILLTKGATSTTYHIVFRKWPVVVGQPKQGKTWWNHGPTDIDRKMESTLIPPTTTTWGHTGILYTPQKDTDWMRSDNPHSWKGQMRVYGMVP